MGHQIGINESKIKTFTLPKQIRAARKNKNKSVSKFLEADKRLGRAKSYQLYSRVLSQFNVVSEKLRISLRDKNSVNHLSLLFAFQNIGQLIMKKLSISNWNQFLEILILASLPDWDKHAINNPAVERWIAHLSNEANRLNELNATILRDRLSSLAKLDYSAKMSKGMADNLKEIQLKYSKEAENAAKVSLVPEIEKRRKDIIRKFDTNIRSTSDLSKEKSDLLLSVKKFTISGSTKFVY